MKNTRLLLTVCLAALGLSTSASLVAADPAPAPQLPVAAAAKPASTPKIVVVNYEKILAGYTDQLALSKDVQAHVDKVRAALAVKGEARAALIRQANELQNTKVTKDDEVADLKKKIDQTVAAIQMTERELNELNSSALPKELQDRASAMRARINQVVQAVAAEVKADLAVDVSTQNAIGLPVLVASASSAVPDVTDVVIARLNVPAAVAPTPALAKTP